MSGLLERLQLEKKTQPKKILTFWIYMSKAQTEKQHESKYLNLTQGFAVLILISPLISDHVRQVLRLRKAHEN